MAQAATPTGTGSLGSRDRPGLISRLLWWINKVLVVLLLFTYLAAHIDPSKIWPVGLLAFGYPYLLLAHVCFIVWWLLFRWRRIWLSLLAILVGWGHVGDHFQLTGRSEPPANMEAPGTKVLSWNVRLFDLYDWTHNQASRKAMLGLIETEDPGILCLQEFTHNPIRKKFRTKSALLEDLHYAHHHDRYGPNAREPGHFGIAIFSRHPIVARGHIDLPHNPNNQCIWADIALDGDTLRVYNAHLASYHFGDRDNAFIARLSTEMEHSELERGGRRILRLLRDGMRSRSQEIKIITAHMDTSPHPVLFCADLNDVPMSYSYTRLRKRLRDAFTESGTGRGGTYIGELPSMRIDHVMHDDRIVSWGFITHAGAWSDHHAISCWVALP